MLYYAPWLVWLIPTIFAVLAPVTNKIHPKVRDYFAISGVVLAVIFAISMVPDILQGYVTMNGQVLGSIPFDWEIKWIPLGDLNGDAQIDYLTVGVLVDPLSVFMANIVSIISSLIMIYSLGYMKGEPDMRRYWFWMDFFVGSMLVLVMADNFILMFYGWEMVGLSSWNLISFWFKAKTPSPVPDFTTEGEYNAHCGLKAFIMTTLGDVFLLIAIGAIGIATWIAMGVPTFNFIRLSENTGWMGVLASYGLLSIFSVFLFLGPVGKSAQFPLHEWLPEAMAGPTTVSALIHAATMVKAGVYLVARVLPIFYKGLDTYSQVSTFFTVVAWIGAFTAFLAATQGMVAKELKKVLAYSTVSQIGYMMLALGAAGTVPSVILEGYTAGTFHLAVHAVFKALLFLGAGAVLHETGTKYMHEMGGLKNNMPWTYRFMIVGAASLSGIPPLAGFFSKELIFTTLWISQQWILFAFAAITAIFTVFYSFRMIGLVFFGKPSEYLEAREHEGKYVHEAPPVMTIPVGILAAVTLVLGFLEPLLSEFFSPITYRFHQETIVAVETLDFAEYLIHTFTSITTLISFGIIAIGFIPAYVLYIKRSKDPVALVSGNALLRGFYTFFYNRWYINTFYYKIAAGIYGLSQKLRRIQTGVLNINVIAMLLGFIVFLLYFILLNL
ncbi:MAG: NADH-quinone oxidoreductase subunit L [Candidatus Odinarchaeota archaeon]|nr:NADH-quinone oxidoreductase subunit L [Candidatus Odinarchaeota archaeon]